MWNKEVREDFWLLACTTREKIMPLLRSKTPKGGPMSCLFLTKRKDHELS